VYNLFYCARSGCGRSLLLVGPACWTKVSIEWKFAGELMSDSKESDLVVTLVECDACQWRRLGEGCDDGEFIEDSLVSVNEVFLDEKLGEVVKRVRERFVSTSKLCITIRDTKTDRGLIAMEHRSAQKKRLVVSVGGMVQVLERLGDAGSEFTAFMMDGRGLVLTGKEDVARGVEDFVGDDEAWKSLLTLECDYSNGMERESETTLPIRVGFR
jgi:hypothetical protein